MLRDITYGHSHIRWAAGRTPQPAGLHTQEWPQPQGPRHGPEQGPGKVPCLSVGAMGLWLGGETAQHGFTLPVEEPTLAPHKHRGCSSNPACGSDRRAMGWGIGHEFLRMRGRRSGWISFQYSMVEVGQKNKLPRHITVSELYLYKG